MINFGNMPIRSGDWSWFKPIAASKGLVVQYDEGSDTYLVYGYDGPEVICCTMWQGEVPASVVEGGYSQSQNDADKAEFEAAYKPIANKAIVPRAADGRVRSAYEKPDASRFTFITHDWADKTTWYTNAGYSADEAATDSGDHLTYTLAHASVVDTYHGKLSGESTLKDAADRSFRVAVKVNGTAKAERDPHYGTGGDYSVNYAAGSVTFFSALAPSDAVTVTYHYATDSVCTLKPATGKVLVIDFAECQFSEDIVVNDSVVFQPYGYAGVFAPQLGYPPTTLIPLGSPTIYKGMRDYQNEAVKAWPLYPPIGGAGWRGMGVGVLVLDWDYVASLTLDSAAGMEIRIWLEHDAPFGGAFSTATLYCRSLG